MYNYINHLLKRCLCFISKRKHSLQNLKICIFNDKDSFDSIEEAKESSDETAEIPNYDDRYAVNSKVFARWVDGTGVYFYAAVIKELVSEEECKVMFLEDKIERNVKKETEVIAVSQLHPGHHVTVKHDIYHCYEVTASLMKYPVKRGNDVEYELSIIL